jgi:hypothetical protein
MGAGMQIIGIDPGPKLSAYCVVDDTHIIEAKILPNNELLDVFKNKKIILEMIASYGMPVGKEVFETVLWIGRFAQVSSAFTLVYRKEIKLFFCNSIKARDSNIRRALIDIYGEPGTKKNKGFTYGLKKDLWAALAVAMYARDSKCSGGEVDKKSLGLA